jgi:hypothetical protein
LTPSKRLEGEGAVMIEMQARRIGFLVKSNVQPPRPSADILIGRKIVSGSFDRWQQLFTPLRR